VQGQSIQNLTAVEFVVVILLASLTSVFTGDPVWSVAGQVDGRSWVLIAYLGVLGTAFAFFMQLRSARLSSSTRVGLILCTEPVFATIFAIAVAGESLGFIQAIGGLLMVGSALVGRAAEASGRTARRPRPAGQAFPPGTGPAAVYDPVGSGHISDTSTLNGRRDE
jgi:drug/metabolite transporter (DMT)-like permease